MHASAKGKMQKSVHFWFYKEGFGFKLLTKCIHCNLLLMTISLFIRPIHFASKISLLHLQLVMKLKLFLSKLSIIFIFKRIDIDDGICLSLDPFSLHKHFLEEINFPLHFYLHL